MMDRQASIEQAYRNLENDEDKLNFIKQRITEIKQLSEQVEQTAIETETKQFLKQLTDEVKAEWINTKDYAALKTKIIGFDADIPRWDQEHLMHIPKTEFFKINDLLQGYFDKKELENLDNLSKKEQQEFFEKVLLENVQKKETHDKAMETFMHLMFKVGPMDSAQFIEWLYTTTDGDTFLRGSFENLEDFLVWKLIKEHNGTYKIPEGTKDESWFY